MGVIMAHFALLDEENIVVSVVVVGDSDIMENGVENELKGVEFLRNLTGHQNWVQTSYNSKKRRNYASIGGKYLPEHDAFVVAKPYPSWVLDTGDFHYKAPVSEPADGNFHTWDEDNKSWKVIG